MSQPKNLTVPFKMRKLGGSKYKNDCAVRHHAVKNSCETSQKKEIKECVAIAAFQSIFILLSLLWQRKS